MKVIELALVVFDASTQARAAIDEAVVAQYAEQMLNGVQFPPVDVFHDGNRYYMGDGVPSWTRGAAQRRGDDSCDCSRWHARGRAVVCARGEQDARAPDDGGRQKARDFIGFEDVAR